MPMEILWFLGHCCEDGDVGGSVAIGLSSQISSVWSILQFRGRFDFITTDEKRNFV